MTYIVMELQTNANGVVGNFIFTYADRNEAESKYHQILGFAAVSTVAVHTAVLMTNDGQLIERRAYRHAVQSGEGDQE